jgi:hypothetical protein
MTMDATRKTSIFAVLRQAAKGIEPDRLRDLQHPASFYMDSTTRETLLAAIATLDRETLLALALPEALDLLREDMEADFDREIYDVAPEPYRRGRR